MGNTSKQTNIEKRRRLSALYERGTVVRFGANGVVDGEPHEDDIAVFVGPPSPLHREMAVRDAQAVRARAMLAVRKDSNSEEYLATANFIASMDDEAIVEYVLNAQESERAAEARRQVLARKEWDDFNALRDAMRQFEEAGSPFDDPEWKYLMDRDAEFGHQVAETLAEIRNNTREGIKLLGRAELEKRATEKRVEATGSAAFVKKYEEAMLFYGCRDVDDHSQLFFDTIEELKVMPEEVYDALQQTLASFITEAAEAKNSPAVGSGSASSELPSEPETSPASTPEDAIGF